MGYLVIRNQLVETPKLKTVSYLEDPRLRLSTGDFRHRNTRWVRSIVLHTTKGLPTKVEGGRGPNTSLDFRIAKLWSTDNRHAGAHLSVDWDGTVCCHCDLLQDAAYHAGVMNEFSIGIEIYQDRQGVVYEDQLYTVVDLVNYLTAYFGIQRQMPPIPKSTVIRRCLKGGSDIIGVVGHRHITRDRGPGDPGDDVFYFLKKAGYMEFSYSALEDQAFWRERQMELEIDSDGLPGPVTVNALREFGFPDGIYMLENDFEEIVDKPTV